MNDKRNQRLAASQAHESESMASETYEKYRSLMFSIAYRMLGSVGEAEDIVQEAYLRLYSATAQGVMVESPKAFLTTVTTHLAIDTVRSARVKRETYIGPWLPEPLVTAPGADPLERAELKDSLSLAFLVVLQRLSPVERAVFLLREVFDYGYDEIAGIVQKSEDNCRQIFARARKRIDDGKPRFNADQREQQELADRFFDAVGKGDLGRLISFLAEDVTFVGDGGGKATSYPMPIVGRERVEHILRGLFKVALRLGVTFRPVTINGQPGVLSFDADGGLINVMALDIVDGAVRTVQSIVNPDKLARLGYPLSTAYHIAPPATPRDA
ncbi:MAG TPA: RNA polymerase sigma-70 factor [Ktedonobacterales bacterium]